LEKHIKKGSREAADEKQSIIGRLKEEQSIQRDPPMVKRVQPWQWASRSEQSADGNPVDRPMA
jgi:hypothetical protein